MIGVVIVAGGTGQRMQAPVRKQYLHLKGLPIVAHALLAFDRYAGGVDRIVLVVPPDDLTWCRSDLTAGLSCKHEIRVVAGGRRRQASVCNGLEALDSSDGIVMIHDGVRPFVRQALIDACLAGVGATGACIPAIPVTDTLKRVNADRRVVGTLERRVFCLAQTPQTFSIELIRRSHRLALQQGFVATDDASVAEFAGETVTVVPGDRDNIKITTPQDLVIAQAMIEHWEPGR